MHKIAHQLSVLLFFTFGASVALGQTQAQCEKEATAAYEYCLQHGIPCVPEEPNCVPHKGSPAQCLPAYNAAYQRCQPSFSWTQIAGPSSNSAWPPARQWAAYWTDAQGNFWLFGGNGLTVPAGSQGGVLTFINDLWKFTPSGLPQSPGSWKLMEGSNQLGAVNTSSMPGGRMSTAFTVDAQGNLWLFGGLGFGMNGQGMVTAGLLNDLWKYVPGVGGTAGTWKLISGQNLVNQLGTNNQPSARSNSVCWIDSNGNFWLFGGDGFSSSPVLGPGPFFLNDLWEYSPSANTWALVSGPANTSGKPVGRAGASYWSDGKGNVWIFGGFGFDTTKAEGPLNDLWFFNSSTGQWSLINGSVTVAGSGGNYGQQAVPLASNAPPGRSLSAWWTDSQGNLWLFGGTNNNAWFPNSSPQFQNLFNDLWEFKPASKTWIWIGGSKGPGSTAPPGASPGARTGAAVWPRSFSNAWLFGGLGTVSPLQESIVLFDMWDGNGTVY